VTSHTKKEKSRTKQEANENSGVGHKKRK